MHKVNDFGENFMYLCYQKNFITIVCMKKNHFFLLVLGVLISVSCTFYYDDKKEGIIDLCSVNKSVSLPICKASLIADYFVTEDMLNEYLKITGKYRNLVSVLPLSRNNDTLAYLVQYKCGWEIIPADTRVGPVMAKSEVPINFDGDTLSLGMNFSRILDYVQDIKCNNQIRASRIWSYLKLRVSEKSDINTKSARGAVSGMWVEVSEEPQYSEEYTDTHHIITAKWWQNHWFNKYMPKTIEGNYVVGCGPVAMGQVIHHFRKANSRNIVIPGTAIFEDTLYNKYPVFSDFSSAHWNSMALNAGVSDSIKKNYTSIFLSYLGQQMGVRSDQEQTYSTHAQMKEALDLYQLSYSEASSYNYYDIYYELSNGWPVIVGSEFNKITGTQNYSHHYYIIDRLYESIYSLKTVYQWVPDYHPTDWELQTLPQWRFEQGFADGREIHEEVISRTEDVYFGMNWGGSGYVDDLYLVRTYTSESEDEAGTIPAIETIYTPIWSIETDLVDDGSVRTYQAKNISSVFFNIREK